MVDIAGSGRTTRLAPAPFSFIVLLCLGGTRLLFAFSARPEWDDEFLGGAAMERWFRTEPYLSWLKKVSELTVLHVVAVTRNSHLADDITQDVIIAACEKWNPKPQDDNEQSSFFAFCATCARNQVADYVRRWQRQPVEPLSNEDKVPDKTPSPLRQLLTEEVHEQQHDGGKRLIEWLKKMVMEERTAADWKAVCDGLKDLRLAAAERRQPGDRFQETLTLVEAFEQSIDPQSPRANRGRELGGRAQNGEVLLSDIDDWSAEVSSQKDAFVRWRRTCLEQLDCPWEVRKTSRLGYLEMFAWTVFLKMTMRAISETTGIPTTTVYRRIIEGKAEAQSYALDIGINSELLFVTNEEE